MLQRSKSLYQLGEFAGRGRGLSDCGGSPQPSRVNITQSTRKREPGSPSQRVPWRKQLRATDIGNPDYFHKVVDCQWACPAHTPVPEYIRLIAHGRFDDAYMINWKSNVFPGILGRTCDRPCEPACRRGRVEDETLVKNKKEPVAICRLKRVAADFKGDGIEDRMPRPSLSLIHI